MDRRQAAQYFPQNHFSEVDLLHRSYPRCGAAVRVTVSAVSHWQESTLPFRNRYRLESEFVAGYVSGTSGVQGQ